MNINPLPYANQEKDKGIRVKRKRRENKMRALLLIAVLAISTNFAFAECTEYMQAFNKHQLVMKGLLDLTLEGNIDKPTVDAIAVRQKEAIKYQDAGEYQKVCEIYDSILSDYGFDKSFGEAPVMKLAHRQNLLQHHQMLLHQLATQQRLNHNNSKGQ